MNRLAMGTLALLLAWASPARADHLSCQHPVMQGTNCVEVDVTKQSWDASKIFHVAVSCVLCSGGSDINCGSAEMVTSAGQLSIMNATTLVKVPGSFSGPRGHDPPVSLGPRDLGIGKQVLQLARRRQVLAAGESRQSAGAAALRVHRGSRRRAAFGLRGPPAGR